MNWVDINIDELTEYIEMLKKFEKEGIMFEKDYIPELITLKGRLAYRQSEEYKKLINEGIE